jgi:hypothetical protein
MKSIQVDKDGVFRPQGVRGRSREKDLVREGEK